MMKNPIILSTTWLLYFSGITLHSPSTPKINWTNNLLLMVIEHFKVPMIKFFYCVFVLFGAYTGLAKSLARRPGAIVFSSRATKMYHCPARRATSPRVLKGDLTHTVSPNLMLILSTYRVVLHPSYLQKVFSFIIFIKERYRFTILSEKSRAPGGVPCGQS